MRKEGWCWARSKDADAWRGDVDAEKAEMVR
jgi:hypothetical protein